MTLTQIATFTRRGILAFVISCVLAITVFIGYQIWYANYLASLPKPEEKPTVKFGILPPPNFNPSNVSSSNYSYQVATQTGGLPNLGKLTKVYFIPKLTATFLATDKAAGLAAKFNIIAPPEASSTSKLRYTSSNTSLIIDTDTGNFTYQKVSTPSSQPNPTDQQILISNFRNFLSFIGILKDELKDSNSKVVAGKIMIWPKDIDQKPIVTANFQTSLVSAEASRSASGVDDYSALNFFFWPVDTTTFSTYPIKTTQQALDDLKSGKAVVVIQPKGGQVSITSVYLAYFESEDYSSYLEPIFVFEGPDFVAYTTAITPDFIAK